MKILIIPDVHGRKFWREYINDEFDHIIFLGDYLDPYPGEATAEEALQEFKDIVNFKNSNLEKVTLLIGNHKKFLRIINISYRKSLGNQ